MKQKIITMMLIGLLWVVPLMAQSPGEAAPDFTVTLAEGGEFTLSDHQGKVVMIFFFGNGCPYCITSGPGVEGIYNTFKDDPSFVAVGLDTWNSTSTTESVEGFAEEAGVTFQLALTAGAVEEAYQTTYDRLAVVDQEGVLRHKGTVPAINDIQTTVILIEGLLMETGQRSPYAAPSTRVFPVPASGLLNVATAQSEGTLYLEIYNEEGKQVMHQKYDQVNAGDIFSLDIGHLQNGLYYYRIGTGVKKESGSFIVDHP